jgi:starch synthase
MVDDIISTKSIEDFDSYVSQTSDETLKQKWKEVKNAGLEGIIKYRQAPSINEKLKGPVVTLVTPEITRIPYELDPEQIITTGDGGGLSEYSAALFAEMINQGINAHLFIPGYTNIFRESANLTQDKFNIELNNIEQSNRIHLATDGLFEDAKKVYNDTNYALPNMDIRRAIHFTKAIIQRGVPRLTNLYPNQPILFHLNDWQVALCAAGFKQPDYEKHNIKSIMTFHNIFTNEKSLYTLNKHGLNTKNYWKELFYRGGFPNGDHDKNLDIDVDFLTSGLHAADMINTVSSKFLEEVVGHYFEDIFLMDDSMRQVITRRYAEDKARGILNAPATTANPEVDPLLGEEYQYGTQDIMTGKRLNKLRFQEKVRLKQDKDAKILYWPHRIQDPQKGVKMFIDLIPDLINYYKDQKLQIAIVANGDGNLIKDIKEYQKQFPGLVAYHDFDREISQIGKAAGDFLIAPSLYEPCGIPHLEAGNYGILPIVRNTGGQAVIRNLSQDGSYGNGFKYQDFLPSGLWWGIKQGMNFAKQPYKFRKKTLQRVRKENLKEHTVENQVQTYMTQMYEPVLKRKLI